MAIGEYRGVNGVARKVKKEYRGVNGVARSVTKAYRGVDGVARKYYQLGLRIFTKFTPSSLATGNITYSTVAEDSSHLLISMDSYRTDNTNWNDDRNDYKVSIKGIYKGDVVSFKFVDNNPQTMTATDIFYGGEHIKTWDVYSGNFSFTASESADLVIQLSCGNKKNIRSCTLSNLKINGTMVDFTTIPVVNQ